MSLLGAIAITLACGYIGFAMADEKKKELYYTEGFLSVTSYILLRLPGLALLDTILAECTEPFCKKAGIVSNKTLHAAIELTKADEPLYGILKRLGETLGCTELARQENALRTACAELESLAASRRAGCAATVRCYRYVGLLGGAALSILLL